MSALEVNSGTRPEFLKQERCALGDDGFKREKQIAFGKMIAQVEAKNKLQLAQQEKWQLSFLPRLSPRFFEAHTGPAAVLVDELDAGSGE
jgi:hypothetical protein